MVNNFSLIWKLAIFPGLIASILGMIFTPLAIKFAQYFKLIDDPKKNKHIKVIHTYPVPRAGSLAIFLAIVGAGLIFLPLDKHLIGIFLGLILVTLTGILDDKYNLNPYLRLFLNLTAAFFPIAAGIGISFISAPGGGTFDLSYPRITIDLLGKSREIWLISDFFACFWIIFIMNILNMGAKGVDGQLPGVVGIAAITIAILSLKFSADITQWPVITLASILAGAFLGFLPFNFYPQKIMPGYGGSTLAGYLLAILSILATTKVGILMVVLGVPLIDTGYTIIRRIASGKSPVWGDRGHLHHRLLDLGWGKRKVTIFYWLITLAFGILALNLNTASKLYTMAGIAATLGTFSLWLTYRNKLKV